MKKVLCIVGVLLCLNASLAGDLCRTVKFQAKAGEYSATFKCCKGEVVKRQTPCYDSSKDSFEELRYKTGTVCINALASKLHVPDGFMGGDNRKNGYALFPVIKKQMVCCR